MRSQFTDFVGATFTDSAKAFPRPAFRACPPQEHHDPVAFHVKMSSPSSFLTPRSIKPVHNARRRRPKWLKTHL